MLQPRPHVISWYPLHYSVPQQPRFPPMRPMSTGEPRVAGHMPVARHISMPFMAAGSSLPAQGLLPAYTPGPSSRAWQQQHPMPAPYHAYDQHNSVDYYPTHSMKSPLHSLLRLSFVPATDAQLIPKQPLAPPVPAHTGSVATKQSTANHGSHETGHPGIATQSHTAPMDVDAHWSVANAQPTVVTTAAEQGPREIVTKQQEQSTGGAPEELPASGQAPETLPAAAPGLRVPTAALRPVCAPLSPLPTPTAEDVLGGMVVVTVTKDGTIAECKHNAGPLPAAAALFGHHAGNQAVAHGTFFIFFFSNQRALAKKQDSAIVVL